MKRKSSIKINRTPPAKTKRILRNEVGFGCPVCGNPYLTWHHFNPPWHIRKHHNPDGMIALCREHHDKADAGGFTTIQLIKLKKHGKGKEILIKGEFNWLRNNLLTKVGGSWFYEVDKIISIKNKPIIWFNRDEDGFLLLNLLMPTTSYQPRSVIKDNWWIKLGDPKDIESPPSGKLLKIDYPNGDMIRLEFSEFDTLKAFTKKFPNAPDLLLGIENPQIDKLIKMGLADNLRPTSISYPLTLVEIDLKVSQTKFNFTSRLFAGQKNFMNNFFYKCSSAINFK